MNEAQYQAETLRELLKTYVELNRLQAQPGERAHMLAQSIHFIEKRIRELLP